MLTVKGITVETFSIGEDNSLSITKKVQINNSVINQFNRYFLFVSDVKKIEDTYNEKEEAYIPCDNTMELIGAYMVFSRTLINVIKDRVDTEQEYIPICIVPQDYLDVINSRDFQSDRTIGDIFLNIAYEKYMKKVHKLSEKELQDQFVCCYLLSSEHKDRGYYKSITYYTKSTDELFHRLTFELGEIKEDDVIYAKSNSERDELIATVDNIPKLFKGLL